MALLAVTHSQWLHSNSILHAWEADGLQTQDVRALQEAIDQQFQTGLEGLYPQDYHLIECGWEMVQRMLGSGCQAWLESIHMAQANHMEQEALDMTGMRAIMSQFLNQH